MKINKLYLAWFFYLLISCYSLHNLNQSGFLYENYSFKLTTQSIKFHWKVSCTFYNFYLENILGQKKIYTIVSGNVGDEKNIHLGDCKKLFYQFNWIFQQSLHLKTTLIGLFLAEKQRALSFIVWREKNENPYK